MGSTPSKKITAFTSFKIAISHSLKTQIKASKHPINPKKILTINIINKNYLQLLMSYLS
jgi:hypothetical protein